MDLKETGKYLAEKRKSKNLTQVKLAEILNVSEKTISKWECGNGFPDTSLILPICSALDISANELLSGKDLQSNEEYIKKAEENLVILKNKEQKTSKFLFALEQVLGGISTILFLMIAFIVSFTIKEEWLASVLILSSLALLLIAVSFCLKIEHSVGFYECQHCKHKYIPTFSSVLFSVHLGRKRYMKCPKCGKRSFNKKKLDNQ